VTAVPHSAAQPCIRKKTFSALLPTRVGSSRAWVCTWEYLVFRTSMVKDCASYLGRICMPICLSKREVTTIVESHDERTQSLLFAVNSSIAKCGITANLQILETWLPGSYSPKQWQRNNSSARTKHS